MSVFKSVRAGDCAAMDRAAVALRHSNSPEGFAQAGALLAPVVLREEPTEASDRLASAMLGSLMLVEAQDWRCDPQERVACSLAAAALAMYRPHAARACELAIGRWMGMGIGSPQRLHTDFELSARVLLGLWRDDPQDAAETLEQIAVGKGVLLGVLCDWLVARIQQHGVARELQCFDHLRLGAGTSPPFSGLMVLGLAVVSRRAGISPEFAVPWFEGVIAARSEKVRPRRSESQARMSRMH